MTNTKTGNAKAIIAAILCALGIVFGMTCNSYIGVLLPSFMGGIGMDLVTASLGFTICIATSIFGSMAAAKIIDRITPRISLVIALLCSGVMLLILGFATNVPMWFAAMVINGLIVIPLGGYPTISALVAQFWGKKTQSVVGIVQAGVSLCAGVGIVALIGTLLSSGTDYHLIVNGIAVVSFAIAVIAFFLLKAPQSAPAVEAEGKGVVAAEDAGVEAEMPAKAVSTDEPGLSLKEAMRTPAFWLFGVAMFCVSFPIGSFATYLTTFFTAFGAAAGVATLLVSFRAFWCFLCNSGSGFFVQKFGVKPLTIIIFGGFAAGIAILMAWTQMQQDWMMYVGIALTGTLGPGSIVASLLIPDMFGKKDYAGINSGSMVFYYIGSVVANLAFSMIAQSFGVAASVTTLAVLGVIGMVLFLMAAAVNPMRKLK